LPETAGHGRLTPMRLRTVLLALIIVIAPSLLVWGAMDTAKLPVKEVDTFAVAGQEITTFDEAEHANKKLILSRFFDKYNSPLKKNVDKFLEVAERYDMDFRLLPAISCIESSCGKKLIQGSYNPFGWGVYGSTVTTFASYNEAIEKVGEGIHKNYIVRGYDTPAKIAPIYTPPAHSHWLRSVNFFMNVMDEISEQRTLAKI